VINTRRKTDGTYQKHYVSSWIAESELGCVTAWVRTYSAVLRSLGLPEASVSYGDMRTMQVWRREGGGRGELLLASLAGQVAGAYKTNTLVKQVQVHVRAMLPTSAAACGLSQDVYEKLLAKFQEFIDAPMPKKPQAVLFAVFFAHLDFVLRTAPDLQVKDGRLSVAHGAAAVKSIEAGEVPQEDMVRGQSLVSQMHLYQDRMSVQARRFFHKESISITDAEGSDVRNALRLYAWATGQAVHLML
jgi:hypothetical protein